MKNGTIGILPWSPGIPNPYQKLTAKSFEEVGTSVVGCRYSPILPLTKTIRNNKNLDALLLDWVHSFYTSKSISITLIKSVLGIIDIRTSKKRTFPMVWNIHNLYRHDHVHKKIEDRCLRRLARNVDGFRIFHPGFEELIRHQFDIPSYIPSVSVPQPNYVEHYQTYPNLDFRDKWGVLEDQLVLLVFGSIRAGKGVERFLETYVKTQRQNTLLVIAGNVNEPSLRNQILKYTEHNGVKLMLRHVDDSEVYSIFKAADVVVLPYEHILNSGVATLAMGFGKPILANDNDSFRITLAKDFSFFFKISHPDSLEEALKEIQRSDLISMGKFAKKESVEKFDNIENAKKLLRFTAALKS